jgi:uncharacterized UBP type Zn finger protein
MNDIYSSLDEYTNIEIIDFIKEDNIRTKANKMILFEKVKYFLTQFPPVLIIQLQRISFNNNKMEKINLPFEFYEEIYLDRYLYENKDDLNFKKKFIKDNLKKIDFYNNELQKLNYYHNNISIYEIINQTINFLNNENNELNENTPINEEFSFNTPNEDKILFENFNDKNIEYYKNITLNYLSQNVKNLKKKENGNIFIN